MGSSGDRGDGLNGHVAGALDGPLVVLLEEDGADEAGDGGFVREDADDLGAPLDLAVQSLERVGRMQLRPVLLRGRSCRRGHPASASSIRAASFGTLGRSWSATRRHCCRAASASFWAKAVATKAETTRRPLLPAWASAFRMKWTRGLLKKPVLREIYPGRRRLLLGASRLPTGGVARTLRSPQVRTRAGTRIRTARRTAASRLRLTPPPGREVGLHASCSGGRA